MIQRFFATTLVLFTATLLRAEGTHPFSVHDMLAMDRISDPQVSPDGKTVAFVLRKTDLDANKGRTDIWSVKTDGSDLRQLTSHPASESNPRWSPDGRWLYFLANRSDSAQVWRIPTDGGEAQQVTMQPLDVGAFNLSHDGMQLAIAMDVYPRTSIAETKAMDEVKAKNKATGKIYDRLMVRHWDSWKDGKRSHVFVVPVWGGDAVDVMPLMDADCPTKPFGGPEDFTFAPDNESVVFAAIHTAGLVSLTHTPSPMGFLNSILHIPPDEKPFLILVVGYPADDAEVPDIQKKSLEEITTFI